METAGQKTEEKKTLLQVRDLCKSYDNGGKKTKVLKEISFDVYQGEFLTLLGESGCGKTTLLNIISGIDRADSGEILFDGESLTGLSPAEMTDFRRKNVGYVFQSYNLMPNLTAIQNLNLIGELVDEPLDALSALKMVGLEAEKDKYPSQLSGGQQQRVSIARALMKRPRLMIADEPTAALDCETSIEVLSVMERVVSSGATLLMVTHNVEITKMADRVIRIQGGKIADITVNQNKALASSLSW